MKRILFICENTVLYAMLGWINRSIKEFILLRFGAEAWDAIVAKYKHEVKWQRCVSLSV